MTDKKNPDYSATAVDLKNDVRVARLLESLLEAQENLTDLEGQANRCVPEGLFTGISEKRKLIGELKNGLRLAIEEWGSYQDIEAGHYAVKQTKVSQVLHVDPFKEHYAQYVPAVIIETVSEAALAGLIKGKLIEEVDLRMFKVITEDVTYAFIIK